MRLPGCCWPLNRPPGGEGLLQQSEKWFAPKIYEKCFPPKKNKSVVAGSPGAKKSLFGLIIPGNGKTCTAAHRDRSSSLCQGHSHQRQDEFQVITGWSWLVVDLPLWKIWKSIGMIIPYIMENKKCSKPPTRKIIRGLYENNGVNHSLRCLRWSSFRLADYTWGPMLVLVKVAQPCSA
jgi:hypothetical protein